MYLGLRTEGGVGEHDRNSGTPIPDHVSARHEDLPELIDGLTAFDRGAAQELDPGLAAAALAFGFVYIHPFEDGNGRFHRYLIHHVLAERGFNPSGLVFPVSAVILDQIDNYRKVLESYSGRLLPQIRWRSMIRRTAASSESERSGVYADHRPWHALRHQGFVSSLKRDTG